MNVDKQEIKAMALACDPAKCADEAEEGRRLAEFYSELTPEVLLALLAESERLETSRSKKERELEQELEVWRHGPFCWTCGDTGDVHDITGEWRAECDCLSAQLINANRERDQLKAENEDYKSGQERYEQIIEDLKAEIEALRKALGEISGQVDGNIRCAVRDVVNCRGDVQDIYGYCDNIDEIIEAAMAKETNHG